MRRRSFPPSLVLIIIGAGCLSDTASYTPAKDDEAMAAIAKVFAAPGTGGLTVSLCEDVDAIEDTNNCQVGHTVRGGGRGRRHDQDSGGIGCGGCQYHTVAYVKGTVSGGPLAGPRAVTGEIQLGLGENPYGFPYDVDLDCDDTPSTCQLTGTLAEDGSLQLTFSDNMSAANTVTVDLTAVGEAACP